VDDAIGTLAIKLDTDNMFNFLSDNKNTGLFKFSENILRKSKQKDKDFLTDVLNQSMLHDPRSKLNLIQRIKKDVLDLDGQPIDTLFQTELYLEFKKFMFLYKDKEIRQYLCPSPFVDLVWREFILFTDK